MRCKYQSFMNAVTHTMYWQSEAMGYSEQLRCPMIIKMHVHEVQSFLKQNCFWPADLFCTWCVLVAANRKSGDQFDVLPKKPADELLRMCWAVKHIYTYKMLEEAHFLQWVFNICLASLFWSEYLNYSSEFYIAFWSWNITDFKLFLKLISVQEHFITNL